MFDELQWYESIHTHGETWVVFVPPYPTLSKGNPMGGSWKIHLLSAEMVSKSIYMRKIIAKILNTKTMFE